MTITVASLLKLASLALDFGRVNRVTAHQDGITPESDTDHTVMLSLIACAVAEQVNREAEGQDSSIVGPLEGCRSRIARRPRLDVGLVAQYALVHDLVEVKTGDVSTLKISDQGREDKHRRESVALRELYLEFRCWPWLGQRLVEYESLASSEARFVKVLDKVMPKLTQLLNQGVAARRQLADLREYVALNDQQQQTIASTYGSDQPEARVILRLVCDEIKSHLEEWEAQR
jgi:5'-deoxynucleotidase YfbR-like HD superfamily hydrolase